MMISLNWIKKFVDLPRDLNPKDLGLKLTLATVEVEGFEKQGENLDDVVVGKIIELNPHPNADKLRLVVVDVGNEKLKVVCGGINLSVGMLVALAKIGARVRWHGEGDLITLEPAKIRGEESQGMICASSEIGLEAMFPSKVEGEIVDFTPLKLKVGAPLAEALGLDDIVYDIDNKSVTNRPDLWGHYGLARELAAIYELPLKKYSVKKMKEGKEKELKATVTVPQFCPRYSVVMVDNIKIGPSPTWLVKSLQAIGCRSINNIVDATNFVMFELGQPLHAFDAGKISGSEIVVRLAKEDEMIVTLDGQERTLSKESLVIADKEKALAIAGVMGGANSEITDNTTSIIIEAANFDAPTVRKTTERLGLRTEASIRFEKCLDPELTTVALKRIMEIISEVCPAAHISSFLVDEYGLKNTEKTIETSFSFLKSRIGSDDLDAKKMTDILKRLGFGLKIKGDNLTVTVPTWRATKDVSIAEDLVEEVARMFGYDNLTPVMPAVALGIPVANELRQLEREVKNILVNKNLASEVYNYSYVGEQQIRSLQLDNHRYVELQNPLIEDQKWLRRQLFPGLMNNVIDNLRFEKNLNIFEVGRVFIQEKPGDLISPDSDQTLPYQPLMAAGAIVAEGDEEPFYRGKELIEGLLHSLRVEFRSQMAREVPTYIHATRYLEYMIDDQVIGMVGEVHPLIVNDLDIGSRVVYWELDLTKLLSLREVNNNYEPIAKFPAVMRDVAIVVEEKINWKAVEDIVVNTAPQFIRAVSLFDVYKSDKIGVGKKSLAFRVSYQSETATLSSDEVSRWQQKVLVNLEKGVGAESREL